MVIYINNFLCIFMIDIFVILNNKYMSNFTKKRGRKTLKKRLLLISFIKKKLEKNYIIALLFLKDMYITKTFEDFNNRNSKYPFLKIHRLIITKLKYYKQN